MNPINIPAVATRTSANFAQAKGRAKILYRQYLRNVPHIATLFYLPYTHDQLRGVVNGHFRKQLNESNPQVVDMLVAKGTMELNEILLQYKQKSHIARMIEPFISSDPILSLEGDAAANTVKVGSREYTVEGDSADLQELLALQRELGYIQGAGAAKLSNATDVASADAEVKAATA